MNTSDFFSPNRQLFFVGGKGGVGKTTLSIALGLQSAQEVPTLVISTDPAHSIAHVIHNPKWYKKLEIPTKIDTQLYAVELNAQKQYALFREKHRKEILQWFESSTYFSEEDTEALFSLSLPGLDELMAFKAITEFHAANQWQRIIVDTAPTGHALRLLQVPELLDDWVKVMATLRWKYRVVKTTFQGKYHPDDADDLLLDLKRTIHRLKKLLKNTQTTEFIVVCKPEGIVFEETLELIRSLRKQHFCVEHLVINDVMPAHFEGEYCIKKRTAQSKAIHSFLPKIEDMEVFTVDASPTELRDLSVLKQYQLKPFSEVG